MRKNEQGMILPIVLAVSILLFILFTSFLSQMARSHQVKKLYIESSRAQYAAESGIAWRQAQLARNSQDLKVAYTKTDDIRVKTEVTYLENVHSFQVKATAFARYGVNQTVIALLEPDTLEILRVMR
jgi:Tfp pilus assembly protein PilX